LRLIAVILATSSLISPISTQTNEKIFQNPSKTSNSKKEIAYSLSMSTHIYRKKELLLLEPLNRHRKVLDTTTYSSTIPLLHLRRIGKRSYQKLIMTTTTFSPKRISINFLSDDHGITRLNSRLISNPFDQKIISYCLKSRMLFVPLSMKISVLVEYTLRFPLWPHHSSLSKRNKEISVLLKIIENSTTPQLKIDIHYCSLVS
jgi:hypothetical protein